MLVEKSEIVVPIDAGMETWQYILGSALPAWVEQRRCDPVCANGTFLIRSKVGSRRVHPGHVVILHDQIAYACPAPDAPALIRELRAEAARVPVPVGPGKKLDKSGAPRLRVVERAPPPTAKRGVARDQKDRVKGFSPPLGSMPTIEWLHVERLSMDAKYQRSTDNDASRRLIASIAANFDWRLCAPLVVSRRADGTMAVIDGQHRTLAAVRRGDIPQLPCCVFSYESPEEEARMFIAANRARKPMNRLDDFHAALAAADDDALQINQLVTDAGLTITRNTPSAAWQPGEIAFTASIATALRKHGDAIVSAALTNLAEAFPDQKMTHSGSIFAGLVKILAHPPEGFDPDRLFRALLKYSAEECGTFVGGLKGGDTRAVAMRQALIMAYDETPAEEVE